MCGSDPLIAQALSEAPIACALCGSADHSRSACPWAKELQPAQRYEAEKQAWLMSNPGASAQAIENACQRIAKELEI